MFLHIHFYLQVTIPSPNQEYFEKARHGVHMHSPSKNSILKKLKPLTMKWMTLINDESKWTRKWARWILVLGPTLHEILVFSVNLKREMSSKKTRRREVQSLVPKKYVKVWSESYETLCPPKEVHLWLVWSFDYMIDGNRSVLPFIWCIWFNHVVAIGTRISTLDKKKPNTVFDIQYFDCIICHNYDRFILSLVGGWTRGDSRSRGPIQVHLCRGASGGWQRVRHTCVFIYHLFFFFCDL